MGDSTGSFYPRSGAYLLPELIGPRLCSYSAKVAIAGATMIRNGLYHITVEMLDGVKGGNQGVMVVRDGTLWALANP